MKTPIALWVLLGLSSLLFGQNTLPLLPYPQHITTGIGSFEFDACTRLDIQTEDSSMHYALAPLIEKTKRAIGIDLLAKRCAQSKRISISLDSTLPTEGYKLEVLSDKVLLKGGSAAGIFYGMQTLLQLLPEAIEMDAPSEKITWTLPCLQITDHPAFAYRGLMLDVARHYMPLDSIKRILDGMAMQKMNRFHWHLTDSQGWRFESLKYPNLVNIGAYRKGSPLQTTYDYDSRPQDTLYGGYYTQEDMRALVQYAQERFITIIPEIEMPAHSRSALASYPHLACSDSLGVLLPNAASIPDDSYCTKDETFTFLTDILSEVMAIFPSPLIHIGGDEAPHQNWKSCSHCRHRMQAEGLPNVAALQSYFIKRIEAFVRTNGRQIIGWDEILEGGLAPHAVVMSWRGTEGGIAAAKSGHYAVMTPGSHCYLDHYQSDDADEPLAWGGLTTLEKIYGYQPVPTALSKEEAAYILGAQGNLWTEFVPTYRQATYMLFPRTTALSEVLWTHDPNRKYGNFVDRLEFFAARLAARGVLGAPHRHTLSVQLEKTDAAGYHVRIQGVSNADKIYYTENGTLPTLASKLYTEPFSIHQSTHIIAAVLTRTGAIRDKIDKQISLHLGMEADVTIKTQPNSSFNKGGEAAWRNGIWGSTTNFTDDQWLGWNGEKFEALLDFGTIRPITQVSTRFFHKPQSWIWVPDTAEFQGSADGIYFHPLCTGKPAAQTENGPALFTSRFQATKIRYLRIVVRPLEKIPAGFNGAGEKPWLFIDEIAIE